MSQIQVKFRCKICGYLYSRKDTLKDHIRGKHNARFSTQELNQLVDTVTPNAATPLNNNNNNSALKNKENANNALAVAAAAAALGAATPLSAAAVNGIAPAAPLPLPAIPQPPQPDKAVRTPFQDAILPSPAQQPKR